MSFKKFNDSQKDNPCAVRRRKKKTVVDNKAGTKMLLSGQELKC